MLFYVHVSLRNESDGKMIKLNQCLRRETFPRRQQTIFENEKIVYRFSRKLFQFSFRFFCEKQNFNDLTRSNEKKTENLESRHRMKIDEK